MKRTERHRLKQNELAASVAQARTSLAEYRTPIVAAIVVVAVILAGFGAYTLWRQRADARAGEMLAKGMAVMDARVVAPGSTDSDGSPVTGQPPGTYPTERAKLEAALPRLIAAAEAYPSARSGIAARYHAAAVLAALGRSSDAERRYREVIDRADGIYDAVARMGLADLQASLGKHEEAIRTWAEIEREAAARDATLPLDGVLMRLGRTYSLAGRKADASRTFRRVVDEFPESPYAEEARKALEERP